MGDPVSGDEVADLLGGLIRNRCVSRPDGMLPSGNESVNAAMLRDVVEGPGVDVEWHEAIDGRASLVARISARTQPRRVRVSSATPTSFPPMKPTVAP
ncbi:MAG: hypothetical protein R2714_05060 [Microthrixaceae bacterium]